MLQYTKDIWFTTYLVVIKKQDIIDYVKICERKAEFCFDISDEEWKNFKLSYSKHILSEAKYFQEKIKDLIN